jgi:predicted nucleotidyltransferase component of viral defense system
MLTYNALVEQAKLRHMPPNKSRGILREYLQILLLEQLYKTNYGKQLYFTGGTYLRLVHDLKRFSEDMDFNANKINEREFEKLCESLVTELNRVGIKSGISFAHWGNIFVSKFNFPDIERFYEIKSKSTRKSGLTLKFEVNRSKWRVKTETGVISGYGKTYPCLCTEKSILFADKIDDLVKKGMGRHLYDIIFMLSNKYSVNHTILKNLGYKDAPFKIIIDCVNKLTTSFLKKQAKNLRPFLFDEQEARLIINAPTIVKKLIEKYK